ncbi:DUF5666 domain-containing protein [Desulfofundulus thermocisternus]|uniref:DUF5666 domain-containing protein n=1 Tax=Desulfofundulus thermocisternus TaxID=42471 RepID=UPI00217E8C39|nr:DUF5666 domain-containing protein [Desulfofundulus thermocisternus]MCS5696556.1 DUF5666 domain-containing protein [Desulfofundulus thermocisternus]
MKAILNRKLVCVILTLCLVLALAFPALAEETKVQVQPQPQDQVTVTDSVYHNLPADLVTMVNGLDLEQLKELAVLVHQRIREQNQLNRPRIEFAGVVTAVYGDTFTVAKGGKNSGITATFTITPQTVIKGEGTLKETTEIKQGMMVKVKATADKQALEVHLIPGNKYRADKEAKKPGKNGQSSRPAFSPKAEHKH